MTQPMTQWSTALPLIGSGALASWMPELDAQRIAAYALYQAMYENVPNVYKVTQRGTDNLPIYLPTPRTLIETANRFLAKGFGFRANPLVGSPDAQANAMLAFSTLFRREEMFAKFRTQKRYGMVRGDAIWHIVADPDKLPGTRISIREVDPAAYFPIHADPLDMDRLTGCHLVSLIPNPTKPDQIVVRRRTYRKDLENGGITTELGLYDQTGWDDRDPELLKKQPLKLVALIESPESLDPRITSLPVYHIKNQRIPEGDFGVSELAGMERIVAAMSQSVSDSDLALSLAGLGVYWTNSGPPTDADGAETTWRIFPGAVIELDEDPGKEFGRTQGITSVTPVIDHLNFLKQEMYEAKGLSDAATGKVDVQVAESGISLYLQLAPLLAANEEKEQVMLPIYDHMYFDLINMWFPVYEQMTLEVEMQPIVQDPMPVNASQRLEQLMSMLDAGIVDVPYVHSEMSKLGWEIPDGLDARAATSFKDRQSTLDAVGARTDEELADPGNDEA